MTKERPLPSTTAYKRSLGAEWAKKLGVHLSELGPRLAHAETAELFLSSKTQNLNHKQEWQESMLGLKAQL